MPLTDDPDTHLLVNGRRCDAVERRDDALVFHLGAAPSRVRIRSRAAIPQELGLARDPRPLGVGLRRIMLTRPGMQRVIEADAAVLTDGFHPFEPDNGMRWTNGDAAVPSRLFAGIGGACLLTLHLTGTTRYIDEGRRVQAA